MTLFSKYKNGKKLLYKTAVNSLNSICDIYLLLYYYKSLIVLVTV